MTFEMRSTANRWRLPFAILITLVMLMFVAYWGGAAKIDALFFVGVLVIAGILAGFGALTWWLYLSPISGEQAGQAGFQLKPAVRQAVSLLAAVSVLLFITGGVWDETWHKLYGVGGPVNDFFWPPHKLLYGSMALTALFAGGALLLVVRGQGDLRARLRAESLIGLLGLASAYLVVSAPSDQLWHIIYGVDITGWSLPHISITIGAALVALSTAALLLSQVPAHSWRGLGQLRFLEMIAFVMLGASLIPVSQAAFVEWEGITQIGDPHRNPAFWTRPEWLYPVVVLAAAMFFSLFALHATRRVGAATVTMLIALALRGVLLTLAQIWDPRSAINLNVYFLMLLPAAALDAWYWLRRRAADENMTLFAGSFLAAIVFLLIGLPRIATTMLYPRIDQQTLPGMIIGAPLLALWFGWGGARFGNWMRSLGARAETQPELNPRVAWFGAAALVVVAVAGAVYLLTARPPA